MVGKRKKIFKKPETANDFSKNIHHYKNQVFSERKKKKKYYRGTKADQKKRKKKTGVGVYNTYRNRFNESKQNTKWKPGGALEPFKVNFTF